MDVIKYVLLSILLVSFFNLNANEIEDLENYKWYTIGEGETLMQFSQRVYGDYRRWTEVAALNGIDKNSTHFIRAGREIKFLVPESSPEANPSYKKILVLEGDSLMKISFRVYGTHQRWREVFEVNKDKLKDENSIYAGLYLNYLPDEKYELAKQGAPQAVPARAPASDPGPTLPQDNSVLLVVEETTIEVKEIFKSQPKKMPAIAKPKREVAAVTTGEVKKLEAKKSDSIWQKWKKLDVDIGHDVYLGFGGDLTTNDLSGGAGSSSGTSAGFTNFNFEYNAKIKKKWYGTFELERRSYDVGTATAGTSVESSSASYFNYTLLGGTENYKGGFGLTTMPVVKAVNNTASVKTFSVYEFDLRYTSQEFHYTLFKPLAMRYFVTGYFPYGVNSSDSDLKTTGVSGIGLKALGRVETPLYKIGEQEGLVGVSASYLYKSYSYDGQFMGTTGAVDQTFSEGALFFYTRIEF